MNTLPDDPWPAAIDWRAPELKPPEKWSLCDLDACHADGRRRRVRTTVWMEVEDEKAYAERSEAAFRRGDWDVVFGDGPSMSVQLPAVGDACETVTIRVGDTERTFIVDDLSS